MSDELKPCPFCGGDAAYFDGIDRENNKTASVVCLSCGAKVWRGDEVRDEAIKAWNTRQVDHAELIAEIERMKSPCRDLRSSSMNAAFDRVIKKLKGDE